jgi:L-threonylcarbamoyladenylate synthase
MVNTKMAKLINVDDNMDAAIAEAKKNYLEGNVFIYPTDTIYGFGANPFNEEAVEKINVIKRRDLGKKYIMLIDSIENLLKYIEVQSEKHIDFLLSIWPNPVSVVLKLNSETSKLLGMETGAFRIPNHRFCLKLISELKMPLISTSVNRSNESPMLEHSMIQDEFSEEVGAIFYSEKKSFFEASTLIDLSNSKPILLRKGKMNFEELFEKFN